VHWDLTTEGCGRVIYTDETSIILGESRGRKRVTQKQDEEWDPMCLGKAFKEYSTFMFWGFIALNGKGLCYIYRPEDKKERAASIIALAAADVLRRPLDQAAHAIQRAELLRQQKDHKRILTHAPTFFFASCERSAREGIVHVKALTDIAIIDVFFSLFSYPPIRNSRHSALLMQNGASNHISQ